MSNETKEKLLAIATEHFVKHGYEGARMDAIATDSGFNKATFYYHFKNKEELYKSVLVSILSTIDLSIQNINPTDTPQEKLKTYLYGLVNFFGSNEHYAILMMREVSSGGKHFSIEVAGGMMKIMKTFVSILHEGIEKKVFRPATPIFLHLMTIGTLVIFNASKSIRQNLSNLDIPLDAGLSITNEEISENLYLALYGILRSDI